MPLRRADRSGFTIVELLVVTSIIALLIAMLMPALGAAHSAAENVRCKSRLSQSGIITAAYAQDNDGELPEFIFSFDAGQSSNIVVLLVPKRAAVTGFDYYLEDITLCPGDVDPGNVRVLKPNGDIVPQKVSYGVNVDLVVRYVLYTDLTHPSQIAFMFDGFMTGPGSDPNHLQGRYDGSMEVVERMFDPRHGNMANTVFLDGHVDSLAQLTPEMIANNGQPYVSSPGNSGGSNGGGNTNGNGNSNGNTNGNGKKK